MKVILFFLLTLVYSSLFCACKGPVNKQALPPLNANAGVDFYYAKPDDDNEDLIFFQETMYVIAGDGLNLRSEQTTQSKVVKTLPFLTKVEIIERDDDLITVDGISSQWYKINVENTTGWVFGGYLSNKYDIPKVNGKNFVAVIEY